MQANANILMTCITFTNRVIPIQNGLSNHVVSADTINTFKDRLDKFWANKSDLHGIGNRSIIM